MSARMVWCAVWLVGALACGLAALPGGITGSDVVIAFVVLVIAPVWVVWVSPWLERRR